ncbi:beta,beta-carotene 15,15'-dioxygenase [Lepeophtheirus salmonis]|uniref:beta,beta-carotene 15,15'-dioxygenase n=1 Tax=Lepeophtheirus salmonis TaxID=72036 RepID=UPI001AE156C5|nr:beta,beta-carotene 15,15'-dioxygenase-like [Lepeophtheirus salmonis]
MDVNKNLFKNASTCEEKIGKLTGSALPAWIRGNVLYNGPCGVYDYDNMTVNHWFDGLSVMSLFKIKNDGNEISFTKKLLQSDAYADNIEHGRSVRAEFGTPGLSDGTKQPHNTRKGSIKPPSSTFLLHRSPSTDNFTPKDATDNCACNFYQYGNLTMASTETAFDRIIDPDTLETGDLVDMSNLVNIKTGRPLRDHNGDLYNVAASFVAGLKYHFIKFPKPEEGIMYARDYFPSDVKFVATLPTRFPHHLSYVHTFGLTDNYLIFCEQPWVSNMSKLMTCRSQGRSFKECLEWMPSENNRFYIIDKSSGRNMEIKYMTDEPFYFLNFINCYECGNHVVVDIIAYDDPEILDDMYIEKLRNSDTFTGVGHKSTIKRFVLPLDYEEDSIDLNGGKWKEATAIRSHNTITLHGSVLCDHKGMEHPKVNPNFLFRKYNFSYVVGWMHSLDGDCHFANAVTKIDVETGMTLSWRTDDEYCHPSEVVFVPNPAGTSEDDGVLISCVSNAQDENEGYIVFISARNMKEIARASFDEAIPYGSHTFYIQK